METRRYRLFSAKRPIKRTQADDAPCQSLSDSDNGNQPTQEVPYGMIRRQCASWASGNFLSFFIQLPLPSNPQLLLLYLDLLGTLGFSSVA